jgi:cytochrome c
VEAFSSRWTTHEFALTEPALHVLKLCDSLDFRGLTGYRNFRGNAASILLELPMKLNRPALAGAIAALLLSRGTCVLAAPDPEALVDQHHCMFCHTVESPFLAPSFQQIAQRYRDVPKASIMLEQKLRLGGRAHWGDTAMPLAAERGGPISSEDAHTLVQWVLSH